jgi:hypothetical protein
MAELPNTSFRNILRTSFHAAAGDRDEGRRSGKNDGELFAARDLPMGA